jgi:hypothetical protein
MERLQRFDGLPCPLEPTIPAVSILYKEKWFCTSRIFRLFKQVIAANQCMLSALELMENSMLVSLSHMV